jgi:outer membrane lipoprotein SlyB
MKSLITLIVSIVAALNAFAFDPLPSADRAPDSFTRDESLRAGNAVLGTVIHLEKSKIQTSATTKGFGALLGGVIGAAVAAKNPNYQAQVITGTIGAGLGTKVAEQLGKDEAVTVFVKINGTERIVTVNQQVGQTLSVGDQILLTDTNGNTRVIKLAAAK